MTGFDSKRRAAQAKLDDDDDTQVYSDTLLIVYQRGFADGKKAAQRTWVGLDEDDIRLLYGKDLNYRDGNFLRYAMAIEQALKERNT